MTKKYSIIQVGEYLYAVDRAFKVGDYFVAQSEREHEAGLIKSYYIESRLLNRSWNTNWYAPESSFGVFHIVATNNPPLKGVLELPPIEKDINTLADEWAADNGVKGAGVLVGSFSEWRKIENVWKAGYKAAQAKGKYSEEDMRNAIDMARAGNTRVYILNHFKSLSKVPKYIEVEMENNKENFSLDEFLERKDAGLISQKPKSNNNIIVGRYIYE